MSGSVPWVAENGDGGRIVLAELPGVDVEMHELDAWHGVHVGRKRQREQVATDREQHVVLIEHLAHVGGETDHRATKQWVRGGKRRRAGHELGIDGSAQGSASSASSACPALRHRIAGHDHRTLGLGEQDGGRLHRRAVAAQAWRHARGASRSMSPSARRMSPAATGTPARSAGPARSWPRGARVARSASRAPPTHLTSGRAMVGRSARWARSR